MAKIGIKGFCAGDDQEDKSHDGEPNHAVRQDKPDGQHRVEGEEDARIVDDVDQPAHHERDEPHKHDGSEELRHLFRAARLDRKQQHKDESRNRQHHHIELRRNELEALDRGEYGDGRRDHGITVEEGGTRHTQHKDQAGATGRDRLPEGHQSEGAALTFIVGIKQNQNVLERDDQHQRPKHQRQHAKHGIGAGGSLLIAV